MTKGFWILMMVVAAAVTPAQADEYEKLTQVLETAFESHLRNNPESRAYLGMKQDNDRWTRRNEGWYLADRETAENALAELASVDREKLDSLGRHQLDVSTYYYEDRLAGYTWRHHWYALSQMDSSIDDITTLLINYHQVDDEADARAYIARLKQTPVVVDDVLEGIRLRAEKGIRPPSFVYPKILENTRALLQDSPFVESEAEALLISSFRDKLTEAGIANVHRLVEAAEAAAINVYQPALERYMAAIAVEQQKTVADDGVWKLPGGGDFYQAVLKRYTTTDLSADEIHERGLNEVARIHSEILTIMAAVDYEGSLQDFFRYMREDSRWYYPETDQARLDYIADTNEVIDRASRRIDDFFNLMPRAGLVVKRVEAFREKNTSAAFYVSPALDGSRPGTYYVPLHRMKDNPRWDLLTTAHHEAIPGHHMQIAIARELENVPLPVRLMGFGAYSEGWALYAEYLAKEMALYEGRPYMDFGRLVGELFRAVRLVVDTGIHSRRWTRGEAIDYMAGNTPYTRDYISGEIERYIVWPAQATSYKIGMLTLLEAREKAEQVLGDRFDIRGFHDVILGQGSMPLTILEGRVEAWAENLKREVE